MKNFIQISNKHEYKRLNSLLILIVTVFLLFVSTNQANSQEVHSKITILRGGSVPISFDSYTKMFLGIEYSDWTRLRILYFDTIVGGTLTPLSTWKLSVRANSTDIPGDGGVAAIALDRVELLVAVNNTGTGTAASSNPGVYVPLLSTDQTIVESGSNSTGIDIAPESGITTEVLITYRVGGNGGPPGLNTILGIASGYYFVDLIFTLEKE